MRIEVEAVDPNAVANPEPTIVPTIPDGFDAIFGIKNHLGQVVHTGNDEAMVDTVRRGLQAANGYHDRKPYQVSRLEPGETYETPYGPQVVPPDSK